MDFPDLWYKPLIKIGKWGVEREVWYLRTACRESDLVSILDKISFFLCKFIHW